MQETHTEADGLHLRLGSIFRQSSVLFFSNMVMLAGGYFFKIFLARTIGADGLGLFALGDSLVAFFLLASTLQLEQAVFRFAGAFRVRNELERFRRLIWAAVFHALLFGTIAAVVLFLSRYFWADSIFHAEALAGVLVWFAIMLPMRALELVTRLFARSYKEVVRVVGITTFVAFPLKIVISVALIVLGFGVYGWLTGETVAITISALGLLWLGLRLSNKEVRRPLVTVRQERQVYGYSATLLGQALLGIASGRLATLILGIFLAPAEVGIYGITVTTVGLLSTLQSTLNGAFAPHISELHASGHYEELARMYYRVTRWDLMAVLPLGVILIVLAEPMMAIFGPTFASSAGVLVILTVGTLVNVGSGPVGTLLMMGGRERAVLWALGIQLVVNVVVLWALLPTLGLVGAAIGYCASTIVYYAVLYVYARRAFPIYLFDRAMLKMLGATGLLAALAFGLKVVVGMYLSAIPLLVVVSLILGGVWALTLWRVLMDKQDRILLGETLRGARARLGFLPTSSG